MWIAEQLLNLETLLNITATILTLAPWFLLGAVGCALFLLVAGWTILHLTLSCQ